LFFLYGYNGIEQGLDKEEDRKGEAKSQKQIVGQGDKGLKLWHSSWYNYS
jgi:hypothetical protein